MSSSNLIITASSVSNPENSNFEAGFQNSSRSALILGRVQVDNGILPFTVAPDCILDRATDQERDTLKELLRSRLPNSQFENPFLQYEYEKETVVSNETQSSWRWTQLDAKDWRYYVIRTPVTGYTSIWIGYASELCDTPFNNQGLSIHRGGAGWQDQIINLMHLAVGTEKNVVLTAESLLQVTKVYTAIANLLRPDRQPGTHSVIEHALQRLWLLNTQSTGTLFEVLGLFAIIESLITHKPIDKGDSINHQITTKVALLSRRFDQPIPYDVYFGNTSPKKVWDKLYGYRSAVAHGSILTFEGEFKILRNASHANEFLRKVTHSLLRNSLNEHELYEDIRAC
ncbi:MAG TPA: hypothetical protein VJ752_07365 [Burkholderiaceae bacterium]|nr:hypothetical protein [Burkholderiaceae bacterium]